MSYEPLHHKYRPQTFADLVGQEAIATTLTNAITSGKIAPAYLLTGPRGTGKTSSARILAKSLNCISSEQPTPIPCGKCEVCRAIARSSALDVIEIDAASNTGVDNIREIIERSQFAPVQCRYKVYVIDECLTGNSLVLTRDGLIRIDNPNIKGKQVLSYNDNTQTWEYKKVLRWLDRGSKQTLVIKTTKQEIQCTDNHLIRTDEGWIQAKNLKPGMQILSPANVDVFQWLTNLETVESVQVANIERVYDIEVEDNHNFVANGLLVHNCHMLSTAAFNALLKTLEEPPDRVIFVLATTDPQRVLPTIISRCQRFDYRRIPIESMVAHLSKIANLEKIDINPEAITLVAQIANGGLRDAESLLDQLSLLSDTITPEKIWELVGAIPERDLLTLLKAIRSSIADVVIEQCRHLMNRGKEPLVVLQNLAGFYLNLLLAKTAPNRPEMVAVTAPTWQELCTEAKLWSLDDILSGQQHLKNSEAQLKNTTQPRLWLEVTLLGLLPLSSPSPTKEITPQFVPKTVPTPTTSNASSQIQKDEPPPVIQEQQIEKPTSTPSVEPVVVQKQEAQPENQDEIWEQMIENIELPTTQTLMRQHGSLLSFKDSVAEISIASEALLKLVRQRTAGVEAAFKVVCHRKIKVNLRLASSEVETVTDAISISPQVSLPPVESINLQVPELTISAPTAQLSTENKQEEVSILSSEVISVNRSESIEAFSSPSQVDELEQQYSEDEITKAAQSLAQYFEGEVVNFTPKSSEVEIQPTPSVIKEELEALETIEQDKKFMLRGRPILEDVDDDDDIPFVRPASMRTHETQLRDSWELEANRPGLWLHGIRDLWL